VTVFSRLVELHAREMPTRAARSAIIKRASITPVRFVGQNRRLVCAGERAVLPPVSRKQCRGNTARLSAVAFL